MVNTGIGTAPPDLKGAQQKVPTLLELVGDRMQPTAPHTQRAVHAASKKTEDREPTRDDRPNATLPVTMNAPGADLLTPTQPAQGTASRPVEPTTVAPPNPLPLVAPAHLEDPSLRVVVLPNIARVSVETQDGGTLSLQVRVHDGVTDIRASGSGAMLVDARQGELRLALAHQGLTLGQFDLTQSDSGSSRHQRPEPPEERTTPTHRPTLRQQPNTTPRADGRLSVKA